MRVHLFISGVVQGVLFRSHARRKAFELGLVGWVKNLPDGRVEAVFEGAKEEIDEMVKWCHQGPAASQVDKVERREEPEKGLKGFEIKY